MPIYDWNMGHPARRPQGHGRAKLTTAQRQAIIDTFRTAKEENPKLNVSEWSRQTSLNYPITAAGVRSVISFA